MAGGFVMGATLQLRDMASNTFNQVRQATNSFRTSVMAADAATNRHERSADKLRGSMFSLKNAIVAAATAASVKVGFDWLVKGNADMETYQNTLAIVLGSQEKATKTLAWAQKFAAQTPFEIPQVVEATTRMSAYGLNAQKTLGIVGDMASVMGKDLMQAVEAVADAQTGEVERLKEFGITKGMIQAQAKALGSNPINSKGQITDQKAFNAALFSLMEKRYSGGMELQSKTFKGMVSNAKDFVATAGRTLGKPIFDEFKKGLAGLLVFTDKLSKSGLIEKWAAKGATGVKLLVKGLASLRPAFNWITTVGIPLFTGGIQLIGAKLAAFISENGPRMKTLMEGMKTNFINFMDTAKPIIDWIKDVGFPGLLDLLFSIGNKIIDVAAYVTENWGEIAPVVTSIIIAMAAWKLAIELVALANIVVAGFTAVYEVVALAVWGIVNATTAWEAIQWLLNIAMDANPIGAVVLALELLGLAIYEVVKHWKDICEWVSKAWKWLCKWNGTPAEDKDVTITETTVKTPAAQAHEEAKKVGPVPTPAKTKYQLLGKNANGTKNWRGGPTWVGERGRELINAPQGSQIFPHRISEEMATPTSAKVNPAGNVNTINNNTSTKQVTIAKLFDKIELHDVGTKDPKQLVDEIVTLLYDKLTGAASILGNADMGAVL
jgi:hypothetical protein